MLRPLLALTAGWLVVLGVSSAAAQPVAAPASAADPYIPEKLVSGKLHFSGSRTMSQLAVVWTDGFRHVHPDVTAELDIQGSETTFDRLAGDEATIALVSRTFTAKEQEAFAQAHPGLRLVAVDAAIDAVAVVVPPDLPVQGLSLPQLKILFGERDAAAVWGDVGLTGEWAAVPVERFAPDEHSGSRTEFYAQVLGPEGRAAPLTAHSWHTRIVEEVAKTRGAIGVVSVGNSHSETVRALPIARADGGPLVPLAPETIADGQYPLIRPLSLVVAAGDEGVKHPLVAEFLRYVLSQSGQDDVVKDGFQPLGRSQLQQQFERLGWNQVK